MSSEKIKLFYDDLADEYDSMTQFEKRFEREEPPFRKFVEQYNLKKVLDAGCGTGFHSILLTKLGCAVTSVDVSGKMLGQLQNNASKYGVSIKRVQSSFQELASKVESDFDAIFCMGNSLPHLLNIDDIDSALINFYSVLKKGGRLFLQILNYTKILNEKKKIQSVREVREKKYIRYYDYSDTHIEFNISSNNGIQNSIKLFPITKNFLEERMLSAKYSETKFYGSIFLEDYEDLRSTDLFIIATK